MRLSRLYVDQQLDTDSRIVLGKESSHYLGTVLRLRVDAELLVFNAEQGEFAARIVGNDKHALEVELGTQLRKPQPAALTTLLGLGISRGDRMDLAIQKATELGVSTITPLYSQYGEVKLKPDRADKKLNHWRKIAVSAAEQCGRLELPTITSPMPMEEWQEILGDSLRLLLDPRGTVNIAQLAAPQSSSIALMIGPEGGFSEQELKWGQAHDFSLINLGPRVLRTETAPIAALAILQHRFGDM